MRKFCCVHCGLRVAVPARHLGQLVTCPECGCATHPLAEQLIALQHPQGHALPSAAPLAVAAVPASVGATPCANCGQAIGRLQKLNLWENHVVCTSCYRALAGEAGAAPRPDMTTAPPAPPAAGVGVASGSTLPVPATHDGSNAIAAPPSVTAPVSSAPRWVEIGGLRVVPLQVRDRLLATLIAVCIAGAAVYGTLSLLRDLTGLLTALALVLLAAASVYLLLRAAWIAGKRAMATRRGAADDRADEAPANEIEAVVVNRRD